MEYHDGNRGQRFHGVLLRRIGNQVAQQAAGAAGSDLHQRVDAGLLQQSQQRSLLCAVISIREQAVPPIRSYVTVFIHFGESHVSHPFRHAFLPLYHFPGTDDEISGTIQQGYCIRSRWGKGFFMEPWKILVVDDDPDVQQVTSLVLGDFEYMDRGIRLLQARSGQEGLAMMRAHPDTAVALIDVVMETPSAGLDLVRQIREELKNKLVRIILRTGQPGAAPEKRVVIDYDINDYKEKSELTFQRLQTGIITALRAWHDLKIIESSREGLEKIIDASAEMFRPQMMSNFASGLLEQIVSLLELNPDALLSHVSSVAAGASDMHDYRIYAAMGDFSAFTGQTLDVVTDQKLHEDVREAMARQANYRAGNRLTLFFRTSTGASTVIHIQGIHTLSPVDEQLLDVFCTNISVAFDNLCLKIEVEDTQRDLLISLGEAIEMRSVETGAHVGRVSALSRLIALELDMGEETAERLALLAPMHDVGKITILDSILNKPGRFTSEEKAIMREHTVNGARILGRSPRLLFQEAAVVARSHHERFDGQGYPDGLSGKGIHPYARIVALVDVFDALVSNRVYKTAWPLEQALAYLKTERGEQFDPEVVDAFFRRLPEIRRLLSLTSPEVAAQRQSALQKGERTDV